MIREALGCDFAGAYNRTNIILFYSIAECVLICSILVNPHPPYLTMDQLIFHQLLYLFVTCVGIGSVQMGEPSMHGKTKMPPMAPSGKLAHAGKCKHARQLLESEQRQCNRRDLLSSLGKNSALAVVAPPPPHTRHLAAMKGMPLVLPVLGVLPKK